MNTRADGSRSESVRARVWLQIALVGLVWLAYGNSLQVPFQFDDWHVIPENPAVRGPSDIPSFFTDISTFSVLPGTRDYRPVFLSSMALAWWVGNGSVLPFHLISVFVHMCCVLLVFSIFRKTFPERGPPDSPTSTEWTAWIGAALFALHPLATEPVVYISSQSVVLSAVFYLLSFRLFLGVYGGAAPSGTKLSWGLRVGSYGAFGLALMSKPIAITLPLNLLSWELLLARPTPGAGLSQRLRKHLPYYAVSAAFILWRGLVMEGPFGAGAARPVVEHILTQTRVLVGYYLGHALVPLGLNVDPEFPTSVSFLDPRFLLAVLSLAGLGWLLYWFRRHRTIVFWSVWFPICLLLTTYGVVIIQVVSEHRVYLSLVGFSAVVALLLARLRQVLEQRVFQRRKTAARLAVAIPVALLMLFYGYQTHSRNAAWSSELTLWEDAVAHGGSWRAYLNYAHALENDGQADEALVHFQKAVELGPYALSHTNLGLAYLKRGKTEAGLEHLRLAAQLFPGSAETRYYLAYGLESIGDLDEAEAELQQALALRPDYVDAYAQLATLYEKREQFAEAAGAYRRVLEIDPVRRSDPDLLFRLAFSYQMQGNREGAAEAYENLLVISPDHRQGTFNLAYLYVHGENREDWARCVILFERVLEIDPEYSEALFHLGTAHRQLGDAKRAAEYDREYIERGAHEDLIERSRARLETDHAD